MRFLRFDSLDALRASLTARLGDGVSTRGIREDLSPAIGQLLLAEARDNERRIAFLRAVLSLSYLVLGTSSLVAGIATVSNLALVLCALWSAAGVALYLALRRDWYRVWLRRVVPTADAVAIVASAAFVGHATVSAGSRPAMIASTTLLSVFLIFTGALRLTRISTLYGTAMATLAFIAVAVLAHLSVLLVTGVAVGLLTSGLLAARVTEVIRRVIWTEVGRMRMAREVEGANARTAAAQAATAAREQVLRMVAHDLRNPLGTLLMSAELVAEPGMSEESRTKQVGVMKRTGARMNTLIRDLLDVARMEGGRLAVDAKPVAPALLVANAVELMRPLAAERSLALDVQMADVLPEVSADVERIGQVFSNLIGNAIKFTPAGGRIVIGADQSDGCVWFSVTDTGPGIPPEQLEQIFGPFWQAKHGDNRGIGLGLSIAKGIVEAHHGKIGVSSEVGVGTRVFFSIASAPRPV